MIFQADIIWHSFLTAALADIRKNLFLMEDAYSFLKTDPLIATTFGQKEIERFKKILEKEINIFTEHRPPDTTKYPNITISLGGGTEDAGKDALGDSHGTESVNPADLGGAYPTDRTVLGPVTPVDYDESAGFITFDDDVSLDKVFEGHFVLDTKRNTYHEIFTVLDNVIVIDPSPGLSLTNMKIVKEALSLSHTRKTIWYYENITLTVASTDSTEAIYLWSLVMYMLVRYKKTLLEARGWENTTYSYSQLFRESDGSDVNNVYGRQIMVRGRVEHSAIESTTPNIMSIVQGLKISDMQSPDSIRPIVDAQLWNGENDEK